MFVSSMKSQKMQKRLLFTKGKDLIKGVKMCIKLKINTDKFMRITVLNLIVMTVFLLSGCAMKFPVPDETNQTILLIPVETRQTLGKFVFTLDVSIKGASGNEVIKQNYNHRQNDFIPAASI